MKILNHTHEATFSISQSSDYYISMSHLFLFEMYQINISFLEGKSPSLQD